MLGKPGSGKTMLLVRLVLGLLSKPLLGGPVPVLLSLASWNPEEERLRAWIEGQLITDYPSLASPVGKDRMSRQAAALLNDGRILPVLDGLDEIPENLLGRTISEINRAMRPGMKIVVAARTDEFRRAMRTPKGVVHLAGAAAVELCDVQTETVLDYLEASAGGSARWQQVRNALTLNSQLPLAQALTTPLMAFLARTVFNPLPEELMAEDAPEPVSLLNTVEFPDMDAVKTYLYDKYVPAAYRLRTDEPKEDTWPVEDALRWLSFLASDLQERQEGTTDLAWWRLRGAAPRWLGGLAVGVVSGTVGAIGLSVPLGLGAGLVVAMAAATPMRLLVPRERRTLPGGLAGGLLGGMAGALLSVALLGGHRLGSYLLGAVVLGLMVAPVAGFSGGLIGGMAGALGGRFIEQLIRRPRDQPDLPSGHRDRSRHRGRPGGRAHGQARPRPPASTVAAGNVLRCHRGHHDWHRGLAD